MLGAKYDEVEAWCNSVVQSGHDLLFDVNLFDHEIRLASKRLKFPVEVCFVSFFHIHKSPTVLYSKYLELVNK